ncbi:MAG: carboxyl-terminal processing protease [Blastocatellia bacterium]|nr:carboxyl-terminal processing protease [Blastocatellia bacterium]
MKNKFSLALVALILVSLAAPAFVFTQTKRDQTNSSAGTNSSGKTVAPATLPGRRPRRLPGAATAAVAQDFSEALSVIQDHYVDGKKIDYNAVYKSSIMGMLRVLDPHSNYFDKEEFDEMQTDQRSEYLGIGASIQNYTIGDSVDTYVAATFQNAPASRAGLRFGDRIDAVDGISMHAKSSSEVRDKIRGPRGSHVRVTITHANTGQSDVVEIVRDAVSQPSVPDAYMIRPGVGYVDMTRGFNLDTAEGLQSALDFLHEHGMNSLVLDLRNNPGGFLDQAIHVAETFLPAGQLILSQKGRNGANDRTYNSQNPNPDRTPLVILVNDYTASASEIVAGAMQDHDRALIVGQTSFGKGLVQSIIHLEYGTGLTLTSAKYYTPSGRLIQRDYSEGGFYNYINRGGTLRDNRDGQAKPAGPASRTDTGRPVYGGGGITPDEAVKPQTLTNTQVRLRDPIFFFSRDVASGRVPALEKYKIDRAIEFGHDLQATDYSMNDEVFNAFRDYVAKDPNWKTFTSSLDRNRSVIEQQIRFQLATAAYGTVTAVQVLTKEDPQIAKAIELVPRARDLAMAATRARLQQP